MRQIIICVFFVFFGRATAATNIEYPVYDVYDREPYIFEDIINSTIEDIRPNIPDPFTIDDFPLTFPPELEILTGSADLSHFELTGLQQFQVSYLNLAVIGMQLNFTFILPSINVNTDYTGDLLLLGLIPLYGNGRANIHLKDVEIEASAQADLTGGISVKNLHLQLYVGDATFDIHGALDNEDFSTILSSILNDVVASFIDNHQEVISNILSPIIETVINAILNSSNTDTTVPISESTIALS